MNLIIIEEKDFFPENKIILHDRRHEHIKKILKARSQQKIKIGKLNGKIGFGTIIEISKSETIIGDYTFDIFPPKASENIICVALPRPQTIKKVLQGIIEFGIKKIFFFQSARVEKSFWQSSILNPEELNQQIILGLEQAVDTIVPEIILRKHFQNFLEIEIITLQNSHNIIFAHPQKGVVQKIPENNKPALIIIGPEGGFIPSEVDVLSQIAQPINLGERILRVEHATFLLNSLTIK